MDTKETGCDKLGWINLAWNILTS